jgi:uncharacterized protein
MGIVMNSTPEQSFPIIAQSMRPDTTPRSRWRLKPTARSYSIWRRAQRARRNRTMERDEAISRLQKHDADLKRLGVERLYMFGSTARGEANNDSDVDLFFDCQKGKLGVYELMDVKQYAAGILGRKTDIMTRDSLHKTLREAIEATAVRVF